MNKKFIAVICAALIICLSVPSVPVLAYDNFKVGTYETLNSLIEDPENTTLIYNIDTSFFSSWTQEDYSSFFDLSSMPFDCFNNNSLWILGTGNSQGNLTIWCMDLTSVGEPEWSCYTQGSGFSIAAFYASNPGVSSVPIHIYIYNNISNSWTNYSNSTISLLSEQIRSYYSDNGLLVPDTSATRPYTYSYQWSAGVTTPFLWGNIEHVYSFNYFNHYNSTLYSNINVIANNFPSFMYANSHENKQGMFDFFQGGNVLYWNGEEYIEPDTGSGEESNANHMYFQRCNFGFCEPSNVNQFSSFGGAYFYIDYGLDNWVMDHISDYQIRFHAEASVGSTNYSFTKRYEVDPDNYITVPFSLFDGWVNPGFSAYVTNRRIDNTFLKSQLYCVVPSNFEQFYTAIANGYYSDSVSSTLQSLMNSGGTGSSGVLLYTGLLSGASITKVVKQADINQNFINELFYSNNFKFRVSATLIDKDGNESGLVSREFDIVRGSDTATDNSGLTNENPYESDDDTSDQLPYIPDNETGSLVHNGASGFVNNINIPNDYTVTYRDGVNDFIDWFNKDPEVTGIQNSFWGAMGVFKGNPANELYSDYFGFLPDGFKSIIYGCAGIGIIGGAATVLRKRLMK